jgi:hypothetical protein
MLHLLDRVENGLIDEDRTGEMFPAMDHAVADGGDLAHVLDDAVSAGRQGLDDQLDGNPVVGAFIFFAIGLPPGNLMDDERIADGDPLDHPLGDDFLSLPVKELVLDRRTATVQCKNIHETITSSSFGQGQAAPWVF